MNYLNSSNTPLEGDVGVPTHSLRGGVGTVQHLKGGVEQFEHPPYGECSKKMGGCSKMLGGGVG